jgi:sRNA-binding regulator protein Hfq
MNSKSNDGMSNRKPSGGGGRPGGGGPHQREGAKTRAPEQTFEEVRYLKHLIDNEIPVRIKLRDNSEVAGTIEYYDLSFIRLTRDDAPNLFIYKHEIKYIREE